MSAFSYSGSYFTKEDEERETKELTDAERQAIIDDMYGRRHNEEEQQENDHNEEGGGDIMRTVAGHRHRRRHHARPPLNNNNNNDTNRDDVPDEILEEFYRTLDNYDSQEIGENFWHAWINHEELVNDESDFSLFIKCENFDIEKAVLRLLEYWNMRVEVFGEEDAFKPLDLSSDSLKDVVPFLIEMPNLCYVLPRDDHGRLVCCWDRTGMSSFKNHDVKIDMKITFYVTNQIYKQLNHDASQDCVWVFINNRSSWDLPPRSLVKLATKTVQCIPIKFVCTHRIVSSILLSLTVPVWKFYLPREQRLRMKTYCSSFMSQKSLLGELAKHGLQSENLPTSIGGTYDEKPLWINECEQIVQEEKRKKRKMGGGTTSLDQNK